MHYVTKWKENEQEKAADCKDKKLIEANGGISWVSMVRQWVLAAHKNIVGGEIFE